MNDLYACVQLEAAVDIAIQNMMQSSKSDDRCVLHVSLPCVNVYLA